jgi:hypothetical protein
VCWVGGVGLGEGNARDGLGARARASTFILIGINIRA